ncbi:Ger(x)C family spore germination protein [Virgibacillus necropolis]|uniref:Spore gernimation protein n=1 Tax=Virgibacillus necropolis TaxID=163877 RepID=A0A221MHB2_9BACI|nr:Ger(x)C family spore germination protein [Virgibacillus necropolis]ASN07024.1 spore gernimation protein [Virgibacillus necropolis]
MGNRKMCLLIISSLVFLLSGCWDQVNIEDRGFVVGISLDLLEKKGDDNYTLKKMEQIVVPAGLGGSMQGGGQQKAFTNITASGESIFEISRKFAAKTSKTPFYEHLKVIVVSEEIAKTPQLFESIMDVYIRNNEMRRSVKVVVSKDEAKNVLGVEPEAESLPAVYIDSVMEINSKTLDIFDPVEMGEIHQLLLTKSSYVIPRVIPEDNRVKNKGAAVIHGHTSKMVGVLTGNETVGLNLITKSNTGGYIKFEIEDRLMIYEVENTKSSIKIDVKDKDNITINIKIDAEGSIAEMFGSETLLKPERFKEIEKNVSKQIEKHARRTIEKAQQELNADIFEFDEKLKQRHYDKWQKIKDDWDQGENLFANCTINVSANAIVRGTGAVDKTKDTGNE